MVDSPISLQSNSNCLPSFDLLEREREIELSLFLIREIVAGSSLGQRELNGQEEWSENQTLLIGAEFLCGRGAEPITN